MPIERSRRYRLGLVSPRLRPGLEQFLQEVGHPEYRRHLPHLPLIRLYVRSFKKILGELTAAQNKSVWLEKTPDHLRCLPQVERHFPQSKIIHIVRSGPDVVASLYDLSQQFPDFWGQYYPTLDACIDRWLEDINISHRYLDRENHILVHYEDLTANPLREIQRLCAFLAVPFEFSMLEKYRITSKTLVRTRETWKAATREAVQNANTQKFYTVFDQQQQNYVLKRLQGSAAGLVKDSWGSA